MRMLRHKLSPKKVSNTCLNSHYSRLHCCADLPDSKTTKEQGPCRLRNGRESTYQLAVAACPFSEPQTRASFLAAACETFLTKSCLKLSKTADLSPNFLHPIRHNRCSDPRVLREVREGAVAGGSREQPG